MIAEALRQIGGRPTRIQTAGQGPTLVWLHDSLGNRWSPGQDRLSERFRLLAPTWRLAVVSRITYRLLVCPDV